MTEIWKPVVGYESQYQVSSLGNVKSLNKGILMSPSTTPNGYSIIACRGYYTKNSRKYPVKSAYGYVWRYAN
jgi:hypothetical protein